MKTNEIRSRVLPTAMLVAWALAARSSSGQTEPVVYTAPDVEGQFRRINPFAEAIGFNDGGIADDPTLLCNHYQSVARKPGPGTPYFFVTRNDNDAFTSCDNEGSACYSEDLNKPGEFLVVRMDSRDTDGERLRSNRLAHSRSTNDTAPPRDAPYGDRVVAHYHFDGQPGWPAWCHPGGTQIVGDLLFVPLELPYGDSCNQDRGDIAIINIANPESPVPGADIYFRYLPDDSIYYAEHGRAIGVIAVSWDPERERYLFLLTGGHFNSGDYVEFWESESPSLETSPVVLRKLDSWYSEYDTEGLDNQKWGGDSDSLEWQTINFVRQDDGKLFIICLDDDDAEEIGLGHARLFEVQRDGNSFDLDYKAEKFLLMTDPTMGDLDAMGGVYITPAGELILYAGEHKRDGENSSVRMGEYRSWNVNHSGIVTQSDGGWVSLYQEYNGWTVAGSGFIMDYRDRFKEDWLDLSRHDDFDNKTKSIRWALPVGQCARLFDEEDYGGLHFDLPGYGYAQETGSFSRFGIESIVILDRPLFPSADLIALNPGNDLIGETLTQYACTQGGELRLSAGSYFESAPVYIANPMLITSAGGSAFIRP